MIEWDKLIEEADAYYHKNEYNKAYSLYNTAAKELIAYIHDTRFTRNLSKMAGWVAAILTGGFGLEDLFIVPAVNRVLLQLFGIDMDKFLNKLSYALKQRQTCLGLSADICNCTDLTEELRYFVLTYRITCQTSKSKSDMLHSLTSLVNPFDSELNINASDAQTGSAQLIGMLLEEIEKPGPQVECLNKYLFVYLTKSGNMNLPLYQHLSMKGYAA